MTDKKTSMLQILGLFTHEQKISHHHSDFYKFISSLSIPLITQDKINIFCKSYDETHDLLASLISFHDIFTFDSANLQKILLFNQAQNKDILKAAPFIYMNSIGFILSFKDGSTFSEYFSIILNSIFSLSCAAIYSNISDCPTYHNIISINKNYNKSTAVNVHYNIISHELWQEK